ncbi:MAG: aminoacyl-tRNA hydrolase [Gammaproteobacteria bacterium]|jgi:PTH1 family peptidyl-tRNA hydrolase|nr:aminoacyl-tRNA hydrolase [Gammaproteobacteria bacterium]MBT3489299.1 aminoacyl-tRNA hydrolase [Gammaproteobacteria bacterium]MBT3718679.1 aminoacyl-tRNA hydrolase [Gammaproteobacteria bacterium]MBT3843775.1 aminoacyl-tRNA hydrolase [Gammaproteobacteria bacterium]MBT3893999.1 aminoacyl-tRNA hydrolase [Gammaproteobacteria bacterium]
MSEPISLIVGLGNPGAEYETTRHNAGFWFLEQIARQSGASFRVESKFHGIVAKLQISGESVWLLKPTTFMNRSGQSVAALASYYKISPTSILVAHDELDLPPGELRLKLGGGHAGHNGLRDITAHLGAGFHRLRIGIGRPGKPGPVVDYVLGTPGKMDRAAIENALDDADRVIDQIVSGEMQKVMNRLHSRGKA